MSDIFIKTAAAGSPGWKRMTALFVKTAAQGLTGWKSALGVWLRRTDSWVRVWPLSGVFSTRTAWIGPDSTTAYADRLTSSSVIRIGSNYYGNNAQWDANGWNITSYSYAWKYYSTNDGTSTGTTFPGESGTGSGWTAGGTGQDVLPLATWDNATNNTTYDRKYLRFEVTANASNSTYSGFDTSPYIQIRRRIPINLTFSLSDYNPKVGTAITYSSTWDTSEARKAESSRTTIQWYRNSTNTTTGGTVIGGATSSSYTPVSADIGSYLYVVETRYNSGTDYDLGLSTGVEAKVVTSTTVADINYQATGNQRRINLPSNFTAGTIVYISTNGYIGIGSDPSGSVFPPSTGRYLMPLQGDQRQTALWTYADSTNFYVRWQGARYNDSAQTIDYQAKFYFNSTAVDVYFVTNNLSSSNPASTTAVYDNGLSVSNWSSSTSQSSTLLSTLSMTRNTTQDGVDDNRTAITAALPPTATNFARADGTVTPSQPSTITFSSSNNQVTSSWTNGSPITSVRFQGSGAGVNTDYTDTTSPFITSDLSNYFSTGTYTATVTNINNSLQVNVSWNQTNTQSYKIHYSSSVFGAEETQIFNDSSSSVSRNLSWSSGQGIFTFQGVTVYNQQNGGGTSNFFTTGLSGITPSQKSSSRSNSTSLTYSLPKLATPTNVSASDNRTDGINITWSTVSEAAYYGVWYGPVPSYDSVPDFGGPNNPSLITGTSYLDTSMGGGVTRNYYVQAFRSGNPAGTKSDWSAGDSGTRLSAVSPPSNTSQPTLSGSLSVGSTVTFGVGSWSNSPTSYDLRLYRGTQFVSSGETLVKSAGNVTSSTYTITQADFNSGQLYLRAFASASNSGGSSGLVAGQEIGPITAGGSAPSTPTGLVSAYNGGTSYTFSWTAVSGATSYQIIPYHATSSAGAGSTAKASRNFTSGSTYDSSVDGGTSSTYVSFAVRATNANGSSAYSAIYTPYR